MFMVQVESLEETLDVQNVQAAAALDCSAVEAPLCCDVAAIDFVGESSALGAAGDATIVLGNNGGSGYAATDSKDATNSKSVRAFLAGRATIVLGDNGRSAFAATDFQDAPNSQGIGDNTLASAFREFGFKGHGEATSVQGDTGSTAFSDLHHSIIRGCQHNSSHHPIHACAHSP